MRTQLIKVIGLSDLTTKKLAEKKAAFSSKYRSRALSRKVFELLFTQNFSPKADLTFHGIVIFNRSIDIK
jgi:hypothetical protein